MIMDDKPILKRGWLGGKTELRISSPFGPRRRPTAGASTNHKGIDISVPVGTQIYAPFAGKLVCQGVSRSAGLYCVLRSGSLELRFMHLSQCVLGERLGASRSVGEGDPIGKTGGARGDRLSGVSTGPHLHFEYRWNTSQRWSSNDALNPARFMSEKLTGSVNHNTISKGLPIRINKTTGEEEGYEVGDKNKVRYATFSEADVREDETYNGAYETDDTATEYYEEEIPNEDLGVNEEYAKGIWQIIKLAMDSNVQDLMLYDSSVSTQTGSILGFFNKACQQPLVEFSGDTYGDQYFFIVRKPPFDKKLMLQALTSQGIFDISIESVEKSLEELKNQGEEFKWDWTQDWVQNSRRLEEWRQKYGFGSEYLKQVQRLENEIREKKETAELYKDVYTITNDEIINSRIDFQNSEIYSWYQFYPQFECSGDDMQYLVPAILFPEYAMIWGSRALQIQSQYASFKGLAVRDKAKNGMKSEVGDKRCRTILDDLKYIIECNAYAPFVRQGTITLKGTRRIKRGMFIQVRLEEGIDEVFYVENVSQSFNMTNNSVQRTTTLQVSHGMVKRYIKDSDKSKGDISYFDLIDFTGYEENRSQIGLGNWRDTISKWKVNREVFKFFLKRQQFILPNERF